MRIESKSIMDRWNTIPKFYDLCWRLLGWQQGVEVAGVERGGPSGHRVGMQIGGLERGRTLVGLGQLPPPWAAWIATASNHPGTLVAS